MTRKEQRRFIRELSRRIVQETLADVPKMPADWDGHELRALLADRFEAARGTVRDTATPGYHHTRDARRSRAFKAACLERNL